MSRFDIYLKRFYKTTEADRIGLVEYYNIQKEHPLEDINIELKKEPEETKLNLIFTYSVEQDFFLFPNLPPEISLIIWEFTKQRVEIIVDIFYPIDYSIVPPVITLKDINIQNVSFDNLDIKEHFRDIIETLKFNSDWSPALHIEKQMLFLVIRMLHVRFLCLHDYFYERKAIVW